MGKFWKDDDVVYAWSHVLAEKIMGLANKEGIAYGAEANTKTRESLHENARDFLGLDPQKILDEWDRMQTVARTVSLDMSDEAAAAIDAAEHQLSCWFGAGADAFRVQLSYMRAFSDVQREYTLQSITALGALLKIAVQAREDFIALASATADTIDKVWEDAEEKQTEYFLKVGNGIVKAVINVLGDPMGAAIAAVENVMDIAVESIVYVMEGDNLGDIVGNYVRQRDRMLDGYISELNQVGELLNRQQDQFLATQSKLLDPLPLTVDIAGPNFDYHNFMSKSRDAGQFGPQVAQEREKVLAERKPGLVDPDSPIQRRLAGEGAGG